MAGRGRTGRWLASAGGGRTKFAPAAMALFVIVTSLISATSAMATDEVVFLGHEVDEWRGLVGGVRLGLLSAAVAYLAARVVLLRHQEVVWLFIVALAMLAFDLMARGPAVAVSGPSFAHLPASGIVAGAAFVSVLVIFLRRSVTIRVADPRAIAEMGATIFFLAVLGLALVHRVAAAGLLLIGWALVAFGGLGILVAFALRGDRRAENLLLGWAPLSIGAMLGESVGGGASLWAIATHGLASAAALLSLGYLTALAVRDHRRMAWLREPIALSNRDTADDDVAGGGAALSWRPGGEDFLCSREAKHLLGLEAAEGACQFESWLAGVHAVDRALLETAMMAFPRRRDDMLTIDFRYRTDRDGLRWLRLRGHVVADGTGAGQRIDATLHDITLDKLAAQNRARSLLHDPLTGLPNRPLLLDRLHQCVVQDDADVAPTGLAIVDLDRFYSVNEDLGHGGGDRVLHEVALRLSRICRPGDTLARTGDDEFTILLPGLSSEDAMRAIGGRILEVFKAPIRIDAQEVHISASIGMAIAAGAIGMPEDLLTAASTALLRAKQQGGGMAEIFRAGPGTSMPQRGLVSLETDLRKALERRELSLFFQPIVSLRAGGIAGFEGLLRWQHPDRGAVPPGSFLWLAEDTGLIAEVGNFVLSEGARHLARWQKVAPAAPGRDSLFLSVNVSSRQLMRGDLLGELKRLFDTNDLASGSLKLEVTESLLIEDAAAALDLLNQAKALGAGLALDDFGTGYSSLSYLDRFPFDTIKIDRSFVSEIGHGRGTPVVMRAMIDLAHELGMVSVAEGVEDDATARLLRELGADYGQGFRFGRPMPASVAEGLLGIRRSNGGRGTSSSQA